MHGLYAFLTHFLAAEDGPTAVEYAAILGFIVLAYFLAVGTIGGETKKSLGNAALAKAVGS
jgi:Flp pilus assembly pilin Flp